ncbi:nitroreductase family deazaflavin-dependent oxidoreductase [Agrococcus beijingensis]|uniref:nitroreductase family deazaflavin-dependent oxidoreductase n=1 Tax=Agrococcus beijingensis TaxID=3068634 RepID=UPI0027422CE3|nr:nitroreductase family deazaflavin-dependent oxidoreductase [Agrococcus sp. REN33]
MRRAWLWFIQRTLNHLTMRIARTPGGPFSIVRHVGRRSGRAFETPIVVARVPEGFVCELTYGDDVDWYRNIVRAGGCVLVVDGTAHEIVAVEPYGTDAGLRAFGGVRRLVLQLLRRREFRLLRAEGHAAPGAATERG